MSVKIEISTTEVKTKSGVAARTGKPYTIREQEAYAYTVDPAGQPSRYPSRIKINLRDDQPAYSPGMYYVAPESFFVDKYDNLSLGLILRPVPAAQVKAA